MGACTVTLDDSAYSPMDANVGYSVRGRLALSASYATGGDTLTAAQLGLGTITKMQVLADDDGYVLLFNDAGTGIQALWTGAVVSTALAEVTATTNLSALNASFIAYGY